jgi:hypothetical protein
LEFERSEAVDRFVKMLEATIRERGLNETGQRGGVGGGRVRGTKGQVAGGYKGLVGGLHDPFLCTSTTCEEHVLQRGEGLCGLCPPARTCPSPVCAQVAHCRWAACLPGAKAAFQRVVVQNGKAGSLLLCRPPPPPSPPVLWPCLPGAEGAFQRAVVQNGSLKDDDVLPFELAVLEVALREVRGLLWGWVVCVWGGGGWEGGLGG